MGFQTSSWSRRRNQREKGAAAPAVVAEGASRESITALSRMTGRLEVEMGPGNGSRLRNCRRGATDMAIVLCFRCSPGIRFIVKQRDSYSLDQKLVANSRPGIGIQSHPVAF